MWCYDALQVPCGVEKLIDPPKCALRYVISHQCAGVMHQRDVKFIGSVSFNTMHCILVLSDVTSSPRVTIHGSRARYGDRDAFCNDLFATLPLQHMAWLRLTAFSLICATSGRVRPAKSRAARALSTLIIRVCHTIHHLLTHCFRCS